MTRPIVYFTRDISPAGLIRCYEALGVTLRDRVAVKISTGEPGGHNFLQPGLIGPLVQKLQGTIVECLTAYPGRRNTVDAHWQTFRDHGFTAIAPCDLLDEEGDIALPVPAGLHLKEDPVGSHIDRYGSILILSHFKGHPMAGLGGALKNMSIGLASPRGKQNIHVAGSGETSFAALMSAPLDPFLESMADADSAVIAYMGAENLAYVNVANRLSVDCDCVDHPAEPEMADIGIFASLDPVAVDQACVDAIVNSPDPGKAHLVKRMKKRHGVHMIEAAAALGLGSRDYELVELA